jgi:hypothetical protein
MRLLGIKLHDCGFQFKQHYCSDSLPGLVPRSRLARNMEAVLSSEFPFFIAVASAHMPSLPSPLLLPVASRSLPPNAPLLPTIGLALCRCWSLVRSPYCYVVKASSNDCGQNFCSLRGEDSGNGI